MTVSLVVPTMGPSGPTGATGPAGAAGAPGPVGPMGAAGPPGPVGPQGVPGPIGATGLVGATGSGATGATGVTGLTGQQGATGPTGASGAVGAQGIAGLPGATGAVGPEGATGPQGASGLQGASGPTGASGATGPAVAGSVTLEVQLNSNKGGLAANSWNTVCFETIVTDVQTAYSAATGLYKPKVAGLYAVTAWGCTQQTAGGATMGVSVCKNGAIESAEGSTFVFFSGGASGAGSQPWPLTASGLIYCNGSTDTISFQMIAGANATFSSPGAMVATLLQAGQPGPQGATGPGPGGPLAVRVFTSNATYTPTAGMQHCMVECVGGGAGGGNVTANSALSENVAAGGGSGGYSRRLLTAAQVGVSQTVTVGAGGAAASAGGTTSFGSLCIANGGAGGASQLPSLGGSTTGAVGDIVCAGTPGMGGAFVGTGVTAGVYAGQGGSSVFGGGGTGGLWFNIGSGGVGLSVGAGGGGGSGGSGAASGGAGAVGVCIVTEFA